MDKLAFIDSLHAKNDLWEAFLDEVSEKRMLQPNVVGIWSVKDVVAHVGIWQRWTAAQLRANAKGKPASEKDLWGYTLPADARNLSEDGFNDWIVAHYAKQTPAESRSFARDMFRRVIYAVEQMPEARLLDADIEFTEFPWQDLRPIWQIIEEMTVGHAHTHANEIRRGLHMALEA